MDRAGTPQRSPSSRPTLNTLLLSSAVTSAVLAAHASVASGWDEHSAAHLAAGLLLGVLAWPFARHATCERRLPLNVTLVVLLASGALVQGVEAQLALLEGEEGPGHDAMTALAGALLAVQAIASIAACAEQIRRRRARWWAFPITAFLLLWAYVVNFVPYTGS